MGPMTKIRLFLPVGLLFLWSCSTFAPASIQALGADWKETEPGIRWMKRDQSGQRIYVVEADLTAGVRVELAGESRGVPVSVQARHAGYVWAVNGGPYTVQDRQGEKVFVPWSFWKSFQGDFARGQGPHRPSAAALVQDSKGTWRIEDLDQLSGQELQAGGGFSRLLLDGKTVDRASAVESNRREPRTAVGLDASGRHLVILVADGRDPGAWGLTLPELAQTLLNLGVTEAVNWDGGGSSTLVHDQGQGPELVNVPRSWGTGERPVATILGLRVNK